MNVRKVYTSTIVYFELLDILELLQKYKDKLLLVIESKVFENKGYYLELLRNISYSGQFYL
jgi:hypothetical protein